MSVVANGTQSSRETLGVHLPCTHVSPATITGIPTGIHPPILEFQVLLNIAIDKHDLVLFGCVYHLAVYAVTGTENTGFGKLPVGFGHIVIHHPPPPDILRIDPVPVLPEQKRNQWRANLFLGMQRKVGKFLTGGDVHCLIRTATEVGRPLTGPPNNHNNAFIFSTFKVEVGHVHICRTSPGAAKALVCAGLHHRLERSVSARFGESAREMVQYDFVLVFLCPEIQTYVQGEDV